MKKMINHKLKLKRGDVVQVIAGKDKGSTGEILEIDRKQLRVWVKGLNMQTKHMKPTQNNQSGQLIKKEGPIHYSNVLLFCKESNKGEKIRIQVKDDGNKQRIFKKSNIPFN